LQRPIVTVERTFVIFVDEGDGGLEDGSQAERIQVENYTSS
jgi:hypothetical protein